VKEKKQPEGCFEFVLVSGFTGRFYPSLPNEEDDEQ
jgi:hypothetical protein